MEGYFYMKYLDTKDIYLRKKKTGWYPIILMRAVIYVEVFFAFD